MISILLLAMVVLSMTSKSLAITIQIYYWPIIIITRLLMMLIYVENISLIFIVLATSFKGFGVLKKITKSKLFY